MRNFILACLFLFLIMLGAIWTSGTKWGAPYALIVATVLLLIGGRKRV